MKLLRSNTGRSFWSLEQQAELFPAEISEDSPWKQETATSVLDPDTENRTQEAINLYFSRHHRISSPPDAALQTPPILRMMSAPTLTVAEADEEDPVDVLGSSPKLAPSSRNSSASAIPQKESVSYIQLVYLMGGRLCKASWCRPGLTTVHTS